MEGRYRSRRRQVVAAVILVVAVVVAVAGVPAAAQASCSTRTEGVVSYCRNVLSSKYFTATITCCIMAQNQPQECWCGIHCALAAAGYDINCFQGTTC